MAVNFATDEDMQLITMRQVGELLQRSQSGMRQLRASLRFGPEVVRIGRRVMVRRAELLAWIQEGCPPKTHWRIIWERRGHTRAAARRA